MEVGFSWFVDKIHNRFDNLTDTRSFSPALTYKVKDAALGAFSMFFSQSPSFLSFQEKLKQHEGSSNVATLFKVGEIPSDNQIRNLLDPVNPSELSSIFSESFNQLEEHGFLKKYRFYDDCLLVPLDGTEYFRSSKIHCNNCSETKHKNGKISYSHKVLTPVMVHPENKKVIPLAPEFITPQDGHEKQDCEINAAKRWIEQNAEFAHKKVIILGDDLFSREPFCQLLLDKKFHFILVCKPSSHSTLYDWVNSPDNMDKLSSFKLKKWNGRFHEITTYRYLNNVPIKSGDDVLHVNFVEVTVINNKTNEVTYKNAFVTDFTLEKENVADIARAGRTRWKVENENNNVLKKQGYHLEHNFGHGKKHLSSTLLTLNLLAFLSHTLLHYFDDKYEAIRIKLRKRTTFFDDFNTLTKYFVFESWEHLMEFMCEKLKICPDNSA